VDDRRVQSDRRALPVRREAGRRLEDALAAAASSVARAEAEVEAAERLLDVAIVARRFGVCVQTVRNWIRAGYLSARRNPEVRRGHFRVTLASVEALQKAQRTQDQRSI